jgi:uncharacterized protein (TIGR00255 family)
MLNSMTGFGRGEQITPSRRYLCELQSVNHRYLEVRSRLPRRLAGLDLLIQRAVQGRFARGRIDVTVTEELPDGEPRKLRLNRTLALEYLSAFKALQAELGLPGEVTLDLLVAVGSRTDQYRHQLEQVKAAQTALELAQIRYQKGLVNYLDVLDAERTVLDAETRLVQTARARLTDMVSLFKALGGGWDPAGPTSRSAG